LPRTLAQGLDRSTVKLHESPNEGQPDAEAATRAGARLRALHEKLERVLPQLIRQPGTVVLHANHELIAFDAGAQPDPAADIGVLRGIVQQVREDLAEPGRIGEERDRFGGEIERDAVATLVDKRAHALDRALDNGAQEERLLAKLDLAARYARDVEQVVDQPSHVLDLPLDDLA